MRKGLMACLLIMVVLLCTTLGGCKAHSSSMEFRADPDAGDVEELKLQLFEACQAMPEVLAATMSAFPSILEEATIKTSDPIELDNLMDGGDGGEIQATLLKCFVELLASEDTEIEFGLTSGRVDMTFARERNPEAESYAPANIEICWERMMLQDARQVRITSYVRKDAPESLYLDLEHGFARCIAVG